MTLAHHHPFSQIVFVFAGHRCFLDRCRRVRKRTDLSERYGRGRSHRRSHLPIKSLVERYARDAGGAGGFIVGVASNRWHLGRAGNVVGISRGVGDVILGGRSPSLYGRPRGLGWGCSGGGRRTGGILVLEHGDAGRDASASASTTSLGHIVDRRRRVHGGGGGCVRLCWSCGSGRSRPSLHPEAIASTGTLGCRVGKGTHLSERYGRGRR